MKNLLLIKLLIAFVLSGFAFANVNAVVSILPQKTFLEKIGGDKVNATLMVKPGSNPHNYEPKASQMKEISKADIYFTIGIEFEDVWMKKFTAQNRSMMVVHSDEGIKREMMAAHSHDEEYENHDEHGHEKKDVHHDDHDEDEHDEHEKHTDRDEHHDEHGEELDPHVWTSPSNVKIIAKNMAKALIKKDPKNRSYYEKNLDKFLKEISKTDREIRHILEDTPKHAKFMVFHPAWGYFAKEYDLEQVAIEVKGKNPKPKQLAKLIHEAKEEKVNAIMTQPEFSKKAARTVAKEVGVPVEEISPLNPKWSENLLKLAKAIAKTKKDHGHHH